MKLTGKIITNINSSFVSFEVTEIPSSDVIESIRDEQSCYEAIWIGKDKTFENGLLLDIGMDDCELSDIDLLLEVMSKEDVDEIKYIKENNY